jgi:SAM-dependent methyltransferase
MSPPGQFLGPTLTWRTLDRYHVRRTILEALRANLPRFSGTLLDVGCGDMPYRSLLLSPATRVETYIGIDIRGDMYGRPDVEWDGNSLPIGAGSVDCAIATEVLEHCPEPGLVLAEIARVLRPGGMFFFTVPFLWPLHDVPYDHYRYTPFALERLLKDAGFARVELRALGGWDASLAQMMGLWARRRPMPRYVRGIVLLLALPLYRFLLWRDKVPDDFGRSTMITGLSGTAVTPGPARW